MSQGIYQVDAFADKPFAGNPEAVCILPRETGVLDDREQARFYTRSGLLTAVTTWIRKGGPDRHP